MGALWDGRSGPWSPRKFSWVGYNAVGRINNCPMYVIFLVCKINFLQLLVILVISAEQVMSYPAFVCLSVCLFVCLSVCLFVC